MRAQLKLCETTIGRSRVKSYVLPAPSERREELSRLAEALKMKGEFQDPGPMFTLKSRGDTLYGFKATDSFLWTRGTPRKAEPKRAVKLPGRSEALGIAEDFVDELGLQDKRAKVLDVDYTWVSWAQRDETPGKPHPVAIHVIYAFKQDGLPFFGPGAKMRVTLGTGGRVNEVYKFWREPAKGTLHSLRPLEECNRTFSESSAFEKLPRSARVNVDDLRLGYYTLPPLETQAMLIPVLAYRGVASTREFEKAHFAHYVLAVDDKRTIAIKARAAIFGGPRDIR